MIAKSSAGKTIVVLGAAIAIAGVAVAADKIVKLSDVPEAVQATIAERAKGATPSEIELEDDDGSQVYEVEFKLDGKVREIKIAQDGKFLKEKIESDDDDDDDDNEVSIDPAKAPEAVTKAITPILKGASIKKLVKENENGKSVYEAEFDIDVAEHSVKTNESGQLLETEKPVAINTLPAAVTNTIKAKYPAGVIKKAEETTENPGPSGKTYFEVKVADNGKTVEVKVDGAGKSLKEEKED